MKKKNSVKISSDIEQSVDSPKAMLSPQKLKILITVVNRPKTEFYVDLIQTYEANIQLILSAMGTASDEIKKYLGSITNEKSVIISIIRQDKEKELLNALDDRFGRIKNGKGIAYTIPMSSTIGVAIYQFLSNTAR